MEEETEKDIKIVFLFWFENTSNLFPFTGRIKKQTISSVNMIRMCVCVCVI